MGIGKLIYLNNTVPQESFLREGQVVQRDLTHIYPCVHYRTDLYFTWRCKMGFKEMQRSGKAFLKPFTWNCLCPDIWGLDRSAQLWPWSAKPINQCCVWDGGSLWWAGVVVSLITGKHSTQGGGAFCPTKDVSRLVICYTFDKTVLISSLGFHLGYDDSRAVWHYGPDRYQAECHPCGYPYCLCWHWSGVYCSCCIGKEENIIRI